MHTSKATRGDALRSQHPVGDKKSFTFNCGVGMMVVVATPDAEKLVNLLNADGENAAIVGELRARTAEPVTFEGKLSL